MKKRTHNPETPGSQSSLSRRLGLDGTAEAGFAFHGKVSMHEEER